MRQVKVDPKFMTQVTLNNKLASNIKVRSHQLYTKLIKFSGQ